MQPASGRGELAVQRPLGDPHDAVVMGDQCAYDSLLRFEAGVRCARGRLAEHQLQYAADDVQVGGFGPITDWVLRAGRDDFGLFEQCVMACPVSREMEGWAMRSLREKRKPGRCSG